jgi:pimeloyl-ACP methyl ester carboxylesterase
MTERMIKANDIDIWTESFGDSADDPLLLIMGATAQGIYWPQELIQHFVDAGRFVVRYDNRDTGQSTCFDFVTDPYSLSDLALDAVGVLDAYGFESAHVAGASMGGMIVQELLLHHRPRVKTATIIMSSPTAGGGDQPDLSADDLPGPDPQWMAQAMAAQFAPAETREEKIQIRIDTFAMLAGSIEPFDTERQRDIAEREVDRATNFAAMNNHAFAIGISQPADRRPLLAGVDVPTLVIHGTEDPILPYAHGVALAETIAGAELMTMDKAGHEMPMCYMDEMVRRMISLQTRHR